MSARLELLELDIAGRREELAGELDAPARAQAARDLAELLEARARLERDRGVYRCTWCREGTVAELGKLCGACLEEVKK